MSEPEIDYQKIRAYAEGLLNDADAEQIRRAIHRSRKAYEAYVSLKEARFLATTGWDVSEKEIQGIFGHLDGAEQHDPERSESESDFSVRFATDRVTVSQSSMDEPVYRGIHAAFPGGWSQTGPVTITRLLNGQTLRVVLTPVPSDREVILDLLGFEGSAELLHKGTTWDAIEDLSLVTRFSRRLPDCGRYEIVLRDRDNASYRIGLALASD